MAWAVHSEWGRDAARIKRELGAVVRTIARYEPVHLLAPPGRCFREARRRFSSCANVTVIKALVDDIWMRDIAPTFAWRGNGDCRELVAIDWNFNGWGGTSERPPRRGDRLAKAPIWGVPRIKASFVAEGGAFIADGAGTLITTRSCLLNPNRNPVRRGEHRQHDIGKELARLGIRRVIWLDGDPCEPITSGHVDGYVMFAPGGVVLAENIAAKQPLWRDHDIDVLCRGRDAGGRKLKVRRIVGQGYLNAYVANGAVITNRFGNRKCDAAAKAALGCAFPKREIIMMRIDCLFQGGGGIHCLTQSMPA
jgi:agmatine deiminase